MIYNNHLYDIIIPNLLINKYMKYKDTIINNIGKKIKTNLFINNINEIKEIHFDFDVDNEKLYITCYDINYGSL